MALIIHWQFYHVLIRRHYHYYFPQCHSKGKMRQVSKVHFCRYCSDACGLQIPIWLCATAVCILAWIFFLFVKLQIYLHMNILKLPTFLHKDVCIKCTFISMCIHKVTIFPIQSLWISWESTYLFNLTILIFNYLLFYHNSIYIFFFFVASFYFPSSFFPSTQPFSSSQTTSLLLIHMVPYFILNSFCLFCLTPWAQKM